VWASLVLVTFALVVFCYIIHARNDAAIFRRYGCHPHSSFGCAFVNGIFGWTVNILVLSLIGPVFIYSTSVGNSEYKETLSKSQLLISHALGISIVFVFTILSYFIEVQTALFSTVKDPNLKAAYITLAIFGAILICFQLLSLNKTFRLIKVRRHLYDIFVSPGGQLRGNNTEAAASFKVRRLIDNALACRQQIDSDSAEKGTLSPVASALYLFNVQSEKSETAGGIIWSWNALCRGDLTRKEGIMIFPRLVACNLLHLCVVAFFIIFFVTVYGQLGVPSTGTMGTSPPFSQQGTSPPFSQQGTSPPLSQQGTSSPMENGIKISFSIGLIPALMSSMGVAITFIPSYITTVIRFRSGILGSLRDKDFLFYRYAQDRVAMLFGSAFWAALLSAVYFWILCSAIAFSFVLFYYFAPQSCLEFIYKLVSAIFGNIFIWLILFCILFCLRRSWYSAFYRRQPARANCLNMFLACWSLSLSPGIILVRSLKLLVIGIFYMGRIDSPLLAPGVGVFWGKLPMDAYPLTFRKDLLAHEAHRHPYIHRLISLYLLKLRNSETFGTPAGAAWRILFTLVLMPWLRKYRIRSRSRKDDRYQADPIESEVNEALGLEVQALKAEVDMLRRQLLECDPAPAVSLERAQTEVQLHPVMKRTLADVAAATTHAAAAATPKRPSIGQD